MKLRKCFERVFRYSGLRVGRLLVSAVMVLMLTCVAQGFDDVIDSRVDSVGPEMVPYSIYLISKPKSMEFEAWVAGNYSSDETSTKYFLPETFQEIMIGNRHALAFKTWEFENYVQNILIDDGRRMTFLSTPHGSYNPDGSIVLEALFGVTLPETQFSRLNEDDHPFAFSEEEAEPEEDTLDVLNDLKASSSCGYKCKDKKKIASYNGIDAYSNGEFNGTWNDCGTNSTDGFTTGYKWQCVELVKRYYFKKFGKRIGKGNANTYCSNASGLGLNKTNNCDASMPDKPQPGNILASNSGHVAIIKEVDVDKGHVVVIHQNWSCSQGEMKLTLTKKKNSKGKTYYCIGGFSSNYPASCWLWPK